MLLAIKTEFLTSNSGYNYVIFSKSSIDFSQLTTSKLIVRSNIEIV